LLNKGLVFYLSPICVNHATHLTDRGQAANRANKGLLTASLYSTL